MASVVNTLQERGSRRQRLGLNVRKELADLRQMTVRDLREKYEAILGESTRSGNKDWLWKRIAWRVQVNVEGGLTDHARRRAEELANDADLRVLDCFSADFRFGIAFSSSRVWVVWSGDLPAEPARVARAFTDLAGLIVVAVPALARLAQRPFEVRHDRRTTARRRRGRPFRGA